MSRHSPKYGNLDTDIELGIGALVLNWKPKCIINLVKFLRSSQGTAVKPQMKPVDKELVSISDDLVSEDQEV